MNRKLAFLLFAACGSAFGFFVGRAWIQPEPHPAGDYGALEPLQAKLREKERELNLMRARLHVQSVSDDPAAYANLSAKEIRAALRKALHDTNPITRAAVFSNMLSNLGPDNIEAVLDVYSNIPMGWEKGEGMDKLINRMVEYRQLFYAWGQFDPEGAIAYCNDRAPDKLRAGFAISGVLRGWASVNPDGALEWTKDPENGAMSKLYNFGLVQGWVSSDLPAATTYVSGLEEGGDKTELVRILTDEQMKKGFSAASRWAEALGDKNMMKRAFSNLAQQHSREHPEEVAAWLKAHAGEIYVEDSLERLGDNWGRQDPEAAAGFFDGLPDGEGKTEGMRELVRHWSKEDPQATGSWLNQKDASPELDPVYAAYAMQVSKEDGAGAMKWAVTITEPEMQKRVVTSVGHNWYRQDKEAVEAWLPQSGLAEETRKAIKEPPKQSWFEKIFR